MSIESIRTPNPACCITITEPQRRPVPRSTTSRPSGRVLRIQDEQGSRHGTVTGRATGWGGCKNYPWRVETQKNGEKRRHREGWAPSWSVGLVDPHSLYKPSSAGYVFSLSVRTAHCVFGTNRRVHHLFETEIVGTMVPGCSAVCAPLSSAWYVPHIRTITSATDIFISFFIFHRRVSEFRRVS